MKDDWAEKLSCATHCYRCEHKLDPKDLSNSFRLLSSGNMYGMQE